MKTLNPSTLNAITLLLSLVACLSSCSPVLYTSVGQNVPMLQKEGEVAMSGGIASTQHTSGFNAQLAAAVTDKVVIMSSFYSMGYATSGNGTYFELGAGKYGYKPKSLCYEVLFGLGFGSIKNTSNDQLFVNVSYIKPFVQPSIGLTSKVADIAFTPRIALVSYTSHSDFINDPQLRSNLDSFYSSKGTTLVFEPGVTFRLGYKNVKLQAQYNYSTFSYSASNFDPVDQDFLSIGIYMLFSDRWLSLKQSSK